MSTENPPPNSSDEKSSLDADFGWWIAYEAGTDDTKARSILVQLFTGYLDRITYYSSRLGKPEDWDSTFLRDLMDNMDFIKERTDKIFEKKSVVDNWKMQEWTSFFDETETLFDQEFMKIRFGAVPIFRYFIRLENKQDQLTEQNMPDESGLKSGDLEDELKVFSFFQSFAKQYNDLIRELKDLIRSIGG